MSAKIESSGVRVKKGKDAIAVNVLGYVLIGLFALVCVIPFYLIIVASFTDESALIRDGYPLLPSIIDFSVQSYVLCLKNPVSILMAYGTTFGVTIIGTAIAVFISTMTGYVLSRQDFPWRNKFSFFFFFTTLFNGGLVPSYILCIRYLNFKNNYLALLLPLMFSVWNMIIAKSFMSGIPSAISESAKMDGASQLTIFSRIVLPISLPVLATIGLFLCFAYWNDWYQSLLYIDDHKLLSLQALLNQILTNIQMLAKNAATMGASAAEMLANMPQEAARMAIVVIIVLPIACAYPFFQKYFISGLTVGAVKG